MKNRFVQSKSVLAEGSTSAFAANFRKMRSFSGKCCSQAHMPGHVHGASLNASLSSFVEKKIAQNQSGRYIHTSSQLLAPKSIPPPKETNPDLEGAKSGIYDIMLRNREWADKARTQGLLRELSAGQQPKYMVIGCADSRCPTEKMMGFAPGECFTVRNIANCVMNGDLSVNAATQFAVDYLGVENILVVGHRDCGGIKAAMTRTSFGTSIDMWVRHVRDVYRQHLPELEQIKDDNERLNVLIEKHVVEQCVNVFKMGFVQRARRVRGQKGGPKLPAIHGLVYDPSTGYLKELDVNIREKSKAYGRVYDVLPEKEAGPMYL